MNRVRSYGLMEMGREIPPTEVRCPFRLKSLTMLGIVLACLITLTGTALRIYKFPQVPVGLQQDEISEAYEAYSLLHTGRDRWGNRLPAYFLSWGSGQNVLQSYLTVPVVAFVGLDRVSTRAVPSHLRCSYTAGDLLLDLSLVRRDCGFSCACNAGFFAMAFLHQSNRH